MFLINYFVPFVLLIIFIFSLRNANKVYKNFLVGINKGLTATLELFPYFLSMVFATTLLEKSKLLIDLFNLINLGHPELYIQGIFKPISGNASYAMMYNIFSIYGVDSKEGIVSSILHSSTDTTLYVATIYTSLCALNNSKKTVIIGLLLNVLSFIMCMILYYFFI